MPKLKQVLKDFFLSIFAFALAMCALAAIVPGFARYVLFEINYTRDTPAVFHWDRYVAYSDKDFRDERLAQRHFDRFLETGDQGAEYVLSLIEKEVANGLRRPRHMGMYYHAMRRLGQSASTTIRREINSRTVNWQRLDETQKRAIAPYLNVLCSVFWILTNDPQYAPLWCETLSLIENQAEEPYTQAWMLAVSEQMRESFPNAPDVFETDEFCQWLRQYSVQPD